MTPADVAARLGAVCEAMLAAEPRLTAADQAIGDGDHGVGMARGFEAARQALLTKPPATASEAFKGVGMAILMKSGGASGAVFGSFFTGMAKSIGEDLDQAGFTAGLREGLAAVQARGGAKPGDKTMIDALVPAIAAAEQALSLEDALMSAAAAAAQGAQSTAAMIATTGKAKTLGARSLGHVDPGAVSLSIMLAALAAHSDL